MIPTPTPPLWVQKFGGTSVATPERIRNVARRIADTKKAADRNLIVVVSAMGATTDELIRLAGQVASSGKPPPQREMDMLLSTGERIAMALLSIALADLDVPAVSFTGSQSGIITDTHHGRARIIQILGDRLRSVLTERKVAIVAGFQGVSRTKEITTLGRGGSD
ncbi:MAG: aspartate kinase, partial [Bdellovibrionota bacterium]